MIKIPFEFLLENKINVPIDVYTQQYLSVYEYLKLGTHFRPPEESEFLNKAAEEYLTLISVVDKKTLQ